MQLERFGWGPLLESRNHHPTSDQGKLKVATPSKTKEFKAGVSVNLSETFKRLKKG